MKTQALFAATALGLVIGCGTTTEIVEKKPADPVTDTPAPTDPAPASDSTDKTPKADNGAPSSKYPAFTPDIGQLVMNGGPVLKNPVVVTVTWPSDAKADQFEDLGDKIGPSQYWSTITSEYGVGPATSGPSKHIRLTEAAPTSISDTQLESFVQSHLSSTVSPAWPAPTGQEIYILYLSKSTKLMLQGQDACQQGVGGYHDSTTVNGKNVAYAIIPPCFSYDETTLSASHELAEAATDPFPQNNPALYGFDSDHLAWEIFQQFQSENGDACEFYRDSAADETDVPYTVQRQWSNKSGAAGHDPCVPPSQKVYFNATPIKQDDITMDLSQIGGDSATQTKGFEIPIGSTKTIPIGLYSDAAKGAWNVKAVEGGVAGGKGGKFDLTLDKTSGQNGEIVNLTITVNASGGRLGGGIISIVSTDATNNTSHYMPIMISTPDAKK